MSEMYFCVYLLFILAYASALKECQLHELGYKKILSAIFMILFVWITIFYWVTADLLFESSCVVQAEIQPDSIH